MTEPVAKFIGMFPLAAGAHAREGRCAVAQRLADLLQRAPRMAQ